VAHFLQLSITTYDDSGIPDLGATEDHWVNIDQVESIRELIADTFFHNVRYTPAFYPHLLLNVASGRELVVPLGEYDIEEEAHAVLRTATDRLVSGTGFPIASEDAVG
jgi:hypothetical protein